MSVLRIQTTITHKANHGQINPAGCSLLLCIFIFVLLREDIKDMKIWGIWAGVGVNGQ